jgi:hypothetical protein
MLLLLLLLMMTHIFNVNTYQQQFNPHKRNTQTLHIPLLLFLYDMFQQFIKPSLGGGYKYIKKKSATEVAAPSQSMYLYPLPEGGQMND